MKKLNCVSKCFYGYQYCDTKSVLLHGIKIVNLGQAQGWVNKEQFNTYSSNNFGINNSYKDFLSGAIDLVNSSQGGSVQQGEKTDPNLPCWLQSKGNVRYIRFNAYIVAGVFDSTNHLIIDFLLN